MSYTNIQGRQLPFLIRYATDLQNYRHLCWNLVGSDLRARFRRSQIGMLWAVIQPLSFSLLIALVWGSVFQTQTYWDFAIYVFSGMILWEYFATVVGVSQDSLMGAEGYLRQTRIPFLIFQVRTPLSALVILGCGVIGLFLLMIALQKFPPVGPHLLLVPIFFAIFLLFAIPVAILMSILGAHYRDAKYASQIVIQALFFVSPVMLGREILQKPELAFMQYLNPMVPMIDLFREPVLYGRMWHLHSAAIVTVWIAGLWAI
jgi:lipopolysaccharide transport system permease protein